MNRPGGNLTGIAALQAQLIAKRIELLSETVRKAQIVTLLVNPTNRYTDTETEILYGGARSLNLQEGGYAFRRRSTRVRFGSKADMRSAKRHVRFTPTSVAEFDAAFKEIKDLRTEAVGVVDLELQSPSGEIDAAFAAMGRERPDAVFVGATPFFNGRRVQLTQLATFHHLPAIYTGREYELRIRHR